MRVDTAARVLPFAAFMAVIGVGEVLSLLAGPLGLASRHLLYLYPVRALAAAGLLWFFRSSYSEISLSDVRRVGDTLLAVLLGVLVFFVWIRLDQSITLTPADAQGFDPAVFPEGGVRAAMVAVRIMGAVLIVPVMEELFWRSFLARYLIDNSFMAVKIGTFTAFSFVATAILFGLEHNLILAGIVAGVVYNFIYWRTKSIMHCILSHAVTNGLLAYYVVTTGQWHYW